MNPQNNQFQDMHQNAYPLNLQLLGRNTFNSEQQPTQQDATAGIKAMFPIDEINGANTSIILQPQRNIFMDQEFQDQQNFFSQIPQVNQSVNFEPNPSFSAFFAPKKQFEYLGQREEQIFQDKVVILPEFDFNRSNQFNLLPTQSYNFDHILQAQHHQQQPNQQSHQQQQQQQQQQQNQQNTNINTEIPNQNSNLIFSTFQNNPAVDLTELFPPRQAPLKKPSPTSTQMPVLQSSQQFFIEDLRENINQNLLETQIKTRENANIPPHPLNNINAIESPRFCNESLQFSTFIGNSYFGLHKLQQQQLQHNNIMVQQSDQLFMCMRNQDNDNNSHCSEALGEIDEQKNSQLINYNAPAIITAAPTKKTISKQKLKSKSKKQENNVFKVVKDNLEEKKKKKDQDKNICRYITRQVVRSLASPEFKSRVLQIIAEISIQNESSCVSSMKPQSILSTYKHVTEFFLGEIENISGFRVLKDMLVVNEEFDGQTIALHKRIFREFMRWYLKERYFRSILSGNMTDKLSFIRYKNKIMLHYINNPSSWNSNKTKRMPSSKPTSSFPPSFHSIQ